jgi:hypothetical protein
MNTLDDFQRIIVLKCLRPDKVTDAMQDFVAKNLGQKFIEPQVKSLISKLSFFCASIVFFFKDN